MKVRVIMLWTLLAIGLGVAAFFVVGPATVWRAVAGDPDMGAQSVEAITRTGKPNDALIVPAHASVSGDQPGAITTPLFAVDADTLFTTLVERISAGGAVQWVEQDQAARYARGLTFSPLLKFPDTNHIWVVPGEDGTSGLYLYAAAQLGQSDLGKNQARLESWMELVNDLPRPP